MVIKWYIRGNSFFVKTAAGISRSIVLCVTAVHFSKGNTPARRALIMNSALARF